MQRRVSPRVGGFLRVVRPPMTLCVAILIVAGISSQSLSAANEPLRTFWTARASLESPDAVRRAGSAAAAGSFDTVMVPVTLVADAFQVFDGAREMINEARARGLRVHAWIEVTLVAGTGGPPAAR